MKDRWGMIWEVHLERASQLDNDWKVVGAEGRKGEPLRIQGYVGGGYCDVRWGGAPREGIIIIKHGQTDSV